MTYSHMLSKLQHFKKTTPFITSVAKCLFVFISFLLPNTFNRVHFSKLWHSNLVFGFLYTHSQQCCNISFFIHILSTLLLHFDSCSPFCNVVFPTMALWFLCLNSCVLFLIIIVVFHFSFAFFQHCYNILIFVHTLIEFNVSFFALVSIKTILVLASFWFFVVVLTMVFFVHWFVQFLATIFNSSLFFHKIHHEQ